MVFQDEFPAGKLIFAFPVETRPKKCRTGMDALREGSSLTELGHRSAVGAPELRAMAPRAIFPG
ncbi:hypothetical protein DRJ58_05760, partial [Candidatus Acetothermia bacterium]